MMKLYQTYLNEVKRPTVSRISRQSKIKRDIGNLATNVAKDRNDSSYDRMKFHLDLYKKYKKRVMDKYSSRVRSQARK